MNSLGQETDCPSWKALHSFACLGLDPEEDARVQEHVSVCLHCRDETLASRKAFQSILEKTGKIHLITSLNGMALNKVNLKSATV